MKDIFKGLIEGRIVHYVTTGHGERPAIVTLVRDKEKGLVDLQVFGNTNNRGEMPFGERNLRWETDVTYDWGGVFPHSWHWVEQE
jgi:hypothetical protein